MYPQSLIQRQLYEQSLSCSGVQLMFPLPGPHFFDIPFPRGQSLYVVTSVLKVVFFRFIQYDFKLQQPVLQAQYIELHSFE